MTTDEIPPHLTDAERGRWWACTATETTSDVFVRRNDLRTISNLRALLADEHAKRCAAELDHAGAVAERDVALAACAEMRAALESIRDCCDPNGEIYWKIAEEALSRPDLGRGMVVVVERESIDEWRDLITDLVFDLNAHSRARKAVADLDALLKEGGG